MSWKGLRAQALRNGTLLSTDLELTYSCNLDCHYCYNDRDLKGRALTKADYFKLLDGLRELSTLFVTLTGGEPLAHPHFFEIGAKARELGFVVRIKSNGHALYGAKLERLKREVDPFNIDISIHGAKAETHDRQTRVAGSFERLMRNIPAVLDVGIRVKLNFTVTAWNADELDEVYAFADSLGVPLGVYTSVTPRDNGDETPLSIEASMAQKGKALMRARERASRRKSQTGMAASPGMDFSDSDEPSASKHLGAPNCGAGLVSLTVDPVGNVLPCIEWRRPVGNVHDESIKSIWQRSGALREVQHLNHEIGGMLDAMGPVGREIGFCPGMAENQTGNPRGFYPDAQQKRILLTDLLRHPAVRRRN